MSDFTCPSEIRYFYPISVRQKQNDSLASSKRLFDKGGATQRTRKSIYATAITARFFWRWDLL